MEKHNNEDFETGFEKGFSQTPKIEYQKYLSATVQDKHFKEQLTDLEFKVQEKKEIKDQLTSQELEHLKNEQTILSTHGQERFLKSKFEKEIEENKALVEKHTTAKENNTTPYPILAAIIYLAAGVIFIIGDLVISHEIVAYALNIKNNMHAWAFAFGLASVSILLKPAYDRLIEQPYLKNQNERNRKIHGIFQGLLVAVALLTLGVLGYFRYESYRVSELKKNINQEIKSLKAQTQTNLEGIELPQSAELKTTIASKLKEFETLNLSLVDSKVSLLSFILSGLLFAVAGAICLGIAFPALQVFWRNLFTHSWQIFWAKLSINRHKKKLTKLMPAYVRNQAQLDFITEKRKLFPSISELNLEINELNLQMTDIRTNLKEIAKDKRLSAYQDGYAEGDSSSKTLTDEELEEFRRIQIAKIKSGVQGPRKSQRPHTILRNAILDDFKESQNF